MLPIKINRSIILIACFTLLTHLSIKSSYSQNVFGTDSLVNILRKENIDTNKINVLNELSNVSLQNEKFDDALSYANKAIIICDSILNINQHRKSVTNKKASALYTIATTYTALFDDTKALEFYLKALAEYRKTNNSPEILNCLHAIGVTYGYLGNKEKSKEYYYKTITFGKVINDYSKTCSALEAIGKTYAYEGDFKQALNYYQKGLNISLTTKDSVALTRNLANIGQVYVHSKEYNKAMEYYSKCLAISEKNNYVDQMVIAMNNIGNVHEKTGNTSDAMRYYQKALEFCTKKDSKTKGYLLNNIGGIYESMGDYDLALAYYIKGLDEMNKMNVVGGIAFSLSDVAGIYLKKKKYAEAEKYGIKSYEFALQSKDYNLISETSEQLSKIYEAQNKYKDAHIMYTIYKQANDTLNSIASAKALAGYENEKNMFELKQKQTIKENEIYAANQEKLHKKNYWILGSIVLLVILLISGVFIYSNFKQKQKAAAMENSLLEQKLYRAQMNPHFLSNCITSIQGAVRTAKISQEQLSSYLSKFARLMRHILETTSVEQILLSKEFEILKNYLDLQNLLKNDRIIYDFNIDESVDANTIVIPSMLLQPFIENSIEHAKPNLEEKIKLSVNINTVNDMLQVEIKDDGVGFTNTKNILIATENHISYATKITRERIRLIKKKIDQKVEFTVKEIKEESTGAVTGTVAIFTLPVNHRI